jgi:hypothetical protein
MSVAGDEKVFIDVFSWAGDFAFAPVDWADDCNREGGFGFAFIELMDD